MLFREFMRVQPQVPSNCWGLYIYNRTKNICIFNFSLLVKEHYILLFQNPSMSVKRYGLDTMMPTNDG